MKKVLILLLLVLTTCLTQAQEAPDGYYFEKYFVFMRVHNDNSYTIREVMTPYFNEPKHGIYRSIPTSIWIKRDISEAQDRSASKMCHYNPKITLNNCNLDYQADELSGVKDIRIGSADRTLTGSNRIILDYELELPDDRIPQADLFFHSIIGTGNPCSTQQVGFRIYFDTPLPQEILDKIEIFKGAEGNQTNYAKEVLIECTPDSISGWVEGLKPYEGVSVYIPLPEGHFTAPVPNDGTIAKIFSVLACIILIYVIYKEIFRSNKVTKVVTFYPPQSVSSAEVGTLFDCSADDQDLISLIPWFANFGYISIKKDNENHLILHRLKDLPDDAPKHQKTLFEALFPGQSETFDTSVKTSVNFGKSWIRAKSLLDNENRKHFDDFDMKIFLWLLLGLLFTALATGYGDANPDSAFNGFAVLICFGIEAAVMAFFSGGKNFNGCIISSIIIFVALFALCSPLAMISDDLYVEREYLGAAIVLSFAASLFAYRLSSMTEYRRNRMGEILGLQEFIRTADTDRLKMLLTEDGQYFYKVLPYAVAFGLADRWASQFEQLTIQPTESINASVSDLHLINHFLEQDNIKHGILAEEKRQADARARARAEAARSRASSGSSWSSSSSYSSGGGGYSGGGSGGGGSRSW